MEDGAFQRDPDRPKELMADVRCFDSRTTGRDPRGRAEEVRLREIHVGRSLVEREGRGMNERRGCRETHQAVGERMRDGLEVSDRRSELLPVQRVLRRIVDEPPA